MPADGKPPLTKDEAAIITWWIEKGKAGNGIKLAAMPLSEEIKPRVAAILGFGEPGEIAPNQDSNVNPDIPKEFNNNLLDSLRKAGVHVRVMSHYPVMLDVSLSDSSEEAVRSIAQQLKAVAKHVIWLNLSDNNLTEKDLDFLPQLINMEKLRLEKNPVSDGISVLLSGLNHLEAVNLNETKITRAGVEKLRQIPNLKRIYTWKTAAE
jgi:hypothetical protein